MASPSKTRAGFRTMMSGGWAASVAAQSRNVRKKDMRKLYAVGRIGNLPYYCTATVTVAGLLALPTLSTTGCGPGARPAGIYTFTRKSPLVKPGAPPAYCTTAYLPPICTVTGATGCGRVLPISAPSAADGVIRPAPVPNSDTISPALAGLVAEFRRKPRSRIAPGPVPVESIENSAGAVVTTGTVTELECAP